MNVSLTTKIYLINISNNNLMKWYIFINDMIVAIKAGHPDEDELYESAIIDTNMVYELKETHLVPYEKFWSILPKIEMLDKNKVIAHFLYIIKLALDV